ncbi:hypothetical protein CRG98_030776 [Punica granatum]|uniref:Uncharacterized protein n=1 Tax=Punica granatum TaxID=22663 RepID=A0A2I0IXV5_PUNGR|nr:hypothetical protein CRG98_030776 [Punica granatum]
MGSPCPREHSPRVRAFDLANLRLGWAHPSMMEVVESGVQRYATLLWKKKRESHRELEARADFDNVGYDRRNSSLKVRFCHAEARFGLALPRRAGRGRSKIRRMRSSDGVIERWLRLRGIWTFSFGAYSPSYQNR